MNAAPGSSYAWTVTRDGEEVVLGMALARIGANAKDVVEAVKAKLDVVRDALPEGMVIKSIYERTDLVNKAVGTATSALIEGSILVAIVPAVAIAVVAAVHVPAAVAISVAVVPAVIVAVVISVDVAIVTIVVAVVAVVTIVAALMIARGDSDALAKRVDPVLEVGPFTAVYAVAGIAPFQLDQLAQLLAKGNSHGAADVAALKSRPDNAGGAYPLPVAYSVSGFF